jgi:y4mF family transcriptional regulator
MDLGSFVRERRRALGLTQQQLADRAGVGLNFVYQLEKNKQTVQLDCARQVLQALGHDFQIAPMTEAELWDPLERPADRRLPWD